jgi:MFS family permease
MLASYLKSYMIGRDRASDATGATDPHPPAEASRYDSDVECDTGVKGIMSTEQTSPQGAGFTPTGTIASATDRRRVVFATVVGTTVEWYDFFIYASAAGLVFGQLFFAPAGEGFAQILSFITVGISFLFRPLGAFLAGHLGDKYGRRLVLMLTLILMGVATTLVGLLPTYAAIGIAAPILLIFLRILQGISAGGEWGGAVLMAVEHAPKKRRGIFGASPQIGVPLGLLLASGIMALMAVIAPGDAFLEWGWRIPFLLSFVLIIIGYYVRRRVEESPVFLEIAERKEKTRMPIVQLFRKHTLLVIIAALVFAGNNAIGYMTTGGFVQRYATDPGGSLQMDPAPVLWAVTGSAVTWLISTAVAGWLSDRIGRRTTYIIGWILQLVGVITLFPLVNTGNVWLLFTGLAILTIGLGFTYGPQAALYAELFPASIRFSGVSISYAIGAILGGAFAPTIAQALVQATGSTESVTWYLAGMTVIGLIATLLLRDRSGIPLGPEHEAEQAASPIYGLSKA